MPLSRRRLFSMALLLSLAAAAPVFAAPPGTPSKPTEESYYGVYLKKLKIGSMIMRNTTLPATGDHGETTRQEVIMTMDLKLLGAPASMTNTSISFTDTKTGKPLSSESRTESGGRLTVITATFTDKAVNYVSDVAGQKTTGTLTLKPGEQFLFDVSSAPDFKPRVGLDMKGKVFIPESLQLADDEIQVTSQEQVPIDGQTVSAFKVIETNGTTGVTTSFLNETGDLLLSHAPLGIEIQKTTKEVALAAPDPNAPPPDLASVVAITPTGVPLATPRTTASARYEISGVTRPLPATDAVQAVAYSGNAAPALNATTAQTATVTVTAHPLPASGGKLYAKPEDAPGALRPYLTATAYVNSDQQTFRDLARQIVGGETDASKAAAKIAVWVHKAVKPDPSIAALRTASDVYSDPRGVCRDYTVLFTAIARAAGLPTKQCVGIVFAEGRFFYHAWPEVWTGGDDAAAIAAGTDWVALEPTFGMPYADATHIKLAEGELTDVTRVAADIGKYQIRVVDAK